MSQYQDYFFQDVERDDECSMLKSPFMNDNCMQEYDFMLNPFFEKDLRETSQYNDVTEIDLKQKNIVQNLQSVSFKKHKRIKRNIHLNQEKKSNRKQIFKGLRNDTIQLNTKFKTILFKKLKQFSALRQLDSKQRQIIVEFGKSVPSFAELQKLKNSQRIASKSLSFIKSSKFMMQIMNGSNGFQIKMTMLKYLQGLKLNFQSQNIIKWKDIKFQ